MTAIHPIFFRVLELIAFLLPAFLPTWQLRVLLLLTYFTIHVLGYQAAYKKYKYGVLSDKSEVPQH